MHACEEHGYVDAGVMEPHLDSSKHSDWPAVFHGRGSNHNWVFANHGDAPYSQPMTNVFYLLRAPVVAAHAQVAGS